MSKGFTLWEKWHDRVLDDYVGDPTSPAWVQLRRRKLDVVSVMGWIESQGPSFGLDAGVLESIGDEIGATREEAEGAIAALLRCGLIREVERHASGVIFLRIITPKEECEEISPEAVQQFFTWLRQPREEAA